MKKIYVLDTSVYLSDFRSLFSFGTNDVVVPLIVLEEIDRHKKRPDIVGTNARGIIRALDDLREKGSIHDGVRITKKGGLIYAKNFDASDLPSSYDASIPDHQIICTALTEQKYHPEQKVIVVSCDVNMRVKCDALGVLSEDYIPNHVIKTGSELYSGFVTLLVDDQMVETFYNKKDIIITTKMAKEQKVHLYPNQFVMLVSNSNNKKTALGRYIDDLVPFRRIKENEKIWGNISAKNKEQTFAIDMLLDENIHIVTMTGQSGSGKTLLSVAAALHQIFVNNKETPKYNRLIVTRPVQPLGRDLGYLPGTVEEKLLPWMGAIQDNLRFLFGEDKNVLTGYMDRGTIELEPLSMIRGRSIQNAFIITDESQNLTKHEIKTILTRVGDNSKIVLIGDINQIDGTHIDETSNGLTYVIEKLKKYDIAGHISLLKGERSKTATLCAEVL